MTFDKLGKLSKCADNLQRLPLTLLLYVAQYVAAKVAEGIEPQHLGG